MIPPPSSSTSEYFAFPTARVESLPASAQSRYSPAASPETKNSAMWEMSNRPAAVRTAWCSARSEVYRTGMAQPPKSVKDAPSASWRSRRAVYLVIWGVLSRGGVRSVMSSPGLVRADAGRRL